MSAPDTAIAPDRSHAPANASLRARACAGVSSIAAASLLIRLPPTGARRLPWSSPRPHHARRGGGTQSPHGQSWWGRVGAAPPMVQSLVARRVLPGWSMRRARSFLVSGTRRPVRPHLVGDCGFEGGTWKVSDGSMPVAGAPAHERASLPQRGGDAPAACTRRSRTARRAGPAPFRRPRLQRGGDPPPPAARLRAAARAVHAEQPAADRRRRLAGRDGGGRRALRRPAPRAADQVRREPWTG